MMGSLWLESGHTAAPWWESCPPILVPDTSDSCKASHMVLVPALLLVSQSLLPGSLELSLQVS